MDLDEWVSLAPDALRSAPIWKVRAFQIATYVASCASQDALELERQPRFRNVGSQLVRAAGSIAANIAEGYARRSRKDRIRYYEYALGSANETSSWYTVIASAIRRDCLDARLSAVARVSQLLLRMIRNERTGPERTFPTRIA